jgi:5'(3')-deoxyribonucleotidase
MKVIKTNGVYILKKMSAHETSEERKIIFLVIKFPHIERQQIITTFTWTPTGSGTTLLSHPTSY